MTQHTSSQLLDQLQTCLSLATNVSQHPEANEVFTELSEQIADRDPITADLVQALWKEVIAARRSAAFWEQISNVERDMTEQMAANHLQLQQNYLRLMQEQ